MQSLSVSDANGVVTTPSFMPRVSMWEAIRDAVASARAKAGLTGPVKLDAPATAERVL